MAPVTLKQTVDAPLAAVWESWDRYADVHSFHPGIENSYLVENSRSTGLGAKRRCDFVGGKNYILEEIVAYEEQRKMTLKIYDGNIPLKVAFVTFTFKPLGSKRTEITATARFTSKFGPLGLLLRPIMREQLGKGLTELLAGNAAYVAARAA
ncbi:SRPBCC family protein [Roseovarius nitratireducens]|uniref:SRPBCC family protein n=1 Tax=Roseovarius nitratireducens TaxID=2044597 RepID=UPI000CE1F60E|nr:SRPBCC family protein [Roseovarius nitratireducens]